VESNWVHSALRPLIGLLYLPRVIMMEELVEWLAGETEVLGENLPQYHFVHHKPHMLPGREPGPPRWEARDLPRELRYGLDENLVEVTVNTPELLGSVYISQL
jgi:hypothetical protein